MVVHKESCPVLFDVSVMMFILCVQVVQTLSLACNEGHQIRRDVEFKRTWHDITITDST